jgi:hypothetical protein
MADESTIDRERDFLGEEEEGTMGSKAKFRVGQQVYVPAEIVFLHKDAVTCRVQVDNSEDLAIVWLTSIKLPREIGPRKKGGKK